MLEDSNEIRKAEERDFSANSAEGRTGKGRLEAKMKSEVTSNSGKHRRHLLLGPGGLWQESICPKLTPGSELPAVTC